MIVSDSDASSENAVDAVLDFSADVLAVDSPTEVDIARSDNGGRVCGGSLRTSAQTFFKAEDGVAGSAADIGYTRGSSQRHSQANGVVEQRNETWQLPSSVERRQSFRSYHAWEER